MDFSLNTEQELLKEATARILKSAGPIGIRRAKEGFERFDISLWEKVADAGLLGLGFDEAVGGVGLAPVELMIVGEEAGRALAVIPFLESVVVPGVVQRHCELSHPFQEVACSVASGERKLSYIIKGLYASTDGEEWRVSGEAPCIAFGDSADGFVIAAESEEGPIVFYTECGADGLKLTARKAFDLTPAARLEFSDLLVEPRFILARGKDARELVHGVESGAVAYIAAEAVGVMETLFAATVEHLNTRAQFGKPLSFFQALQHRVAEMSVAVEQARSAAIYAASIGESDPKELRKSAAATKAVIALSSQFVGQNAVQLHGGVGLTDEHVVGRGMRRLTMLEMLFGDAETSAARLAELGGFTSAA